MQITLIFQRKHSAPSLILKERVLGTKEEPAQGYDKPYTKHSLQYTVKAHTVKNYMSLMQHCSLIVCMSIVLRGIVVGTSD